MTLNILNAKIRLYNYEQSPVGFPSQYNQNGVYLRGRDEDEEFVVERVPLDDIEAENTKSDLFKVGRLRFHPDEEDEMYKKLGIEDRSNIVSDRELIEILKDDSIENIRRISNIKSSTLITRMKTMLFSMERNNNTAPQYVTSAVNERNNELKYGGKRNKDSVINKMLDANQKQNDENKLREQVSELSKVVEQLKKDSEEKDKAIEQSTSALSDMLALVEKLKQENSQATKEIKVTEDAIEKPMQKRTTKAKKTE